MKLGLTSRKQDNLDLALLGLGQRGSLNLYLLAAALCVLHFERAPAAQLDAIVEELARRQAIGPKTGAGIIDLQQVNGFAGPVFDGHIDVSRVTAG